ncbi:MAG TPA: UDP-glucose/GDP-mannose dehydrogenase family protein, partial [Candidatus Elarobacter sp.]|nr:UDP-glucose/GDP-mannose dehydrogenase family protein [Candidatus Elarobacter sp.]
VEDADVVFIAVGTPPDEDGSADLSHVLAVAETIGRHLQRETVVVTKSTVPVGTAALVKAALAKHAAQPFHVVSNPEFLKEGAAVDDFLKPDRVVLGVESDFARQVMGELYAPFVRTGRPILYMDIPSAEMTKYAANGMLATRIGFMNEIAALCEATGANVDAVRRGLGSDTRIGPSFLFPGPGYGGSCFPKDVKALVQTGCASGTSLEIIAAVDSSNERQKRRLVEKVRGALGGSVAGKHVAVWGLSFKPGTDDMREAPSLVLITALLAEGATVCAHDPAAMDEARRHLGDRIGYAETGYEALVGADALVIVTDWNEYRNPDFRRVKTTLKRPLIVDARNLYDPDKMASIGLTYHSLGRPSAVPQDAIA